MNLASLDLNLLLPLHAMLEEQSITKAAKRLGLTPSAISHARTRLEAIFDDPLLVRAGRTMELTPKAQTLLPQLQEVIQAAQRLFASAQDFDPKSMTKTIRIAATDHISMILGPGLDERLRRHAPQVNVHFKPLHERILDDFRADELDLAIGIFHELPGELYIQRLFEDSYISVARQDATVAAPRSMDEFLARDHVLVSPRGGSTGRLDVELEAIGLSRRVARVEQSFLAAMALVGQTDYVLTLSRRLAERFAPTFGLARFETPLSLPNYTLSQLWHQRHHEDPAHIWMRQLLLELASELPPAPPAFKLVGSLMVKEH